MTVVYWANRHSRIGVSEVKKGIQNIKIYLKGSGLERARKNANCIFSIKMRQLMEKSETVVQGENVFWVNQIKLFYLHLKSNLAWEDEIIAIVRKWDNIM
jgi:hypothetical protein